MSPNILSNESISNFIFEKLENIYDIIHFSEINRCCNSTAKFTVHNLKTDYIFNKYVKYTNKYLSTYENCQVFGMFGYYINDCYKCLKELEKFINTNKNYLGELSENFYVLKNDLLEYEYKVLEESLSCV